MAKKIAKTSKKSVKAKKLSKGSKLICDDCGLTLVVQSPCDCEDCGSFECCGEPMRSI
jgi:hypothetical protein